VLLPWPILYETLRTRFVKHSSWTAAFSRRIRGQQYQLVDDREYRELALEQCLESAARSARQLSLVDMVIRSMIDDPHMRVDYLATYNTKDFSDVCAKRHVEFAVNIAATAVADAP